MTHTPVSAGQRVCAGPFRYKMGTSGCREKYSIFTLDFVGNLTQAVCLFLKQHYSASDLGQRGIIVGSDPRLDNPLRVRHVVAICAAHGIRTWLANSDGIASTPAVSFLIRKHKTCGGIILTASHNPGGPQGDAGFKFNSENGGPALPSISHAIVDIANQLGEYFLLTEPEVIASGLSHRLAAVSEYADAMAELFDFNLIKQSRLSLLIDTMHGATGAFAQEIFVNRLGLSCQIIHADPLGDFGGRHPEPVEKNLPEVLAQMQQGNFDLAAAYDSDGDRNKHVGRGGFVVSASDLLAILAEHLPNLKGVGRSMPTSRAVDRVATAKGLPLYETPTGWKFFVNLMEAGKLNLAGEESDGISSDHIREKDGIWATLALLSVMASTGKSLEVLNRELWQHYGRIYYKRVNYPNIEPDRQKKIEARLSQTAGVKIFLYTDLDGSVSANEGWIFEFGADERIVYRFSGTDTTATLRQYVERAYKQMDAQESEVLQVLVDHAQQFLG